MTTNKLIKLDNNNIRLATLCADVTVYWRGSIFDRTEGVLKFYRKALELIGNSLRYYETETMGGVEKIKSDTFDLLPFWLRNPKARRGLYALLLESGEQFESSDRAFILFCDQEEQPEMGVIRLVLPVAEMEQAPAAFVSLVTDLTDELDFESGYAGYSINWEPRGENALVVEEFLNRISKQYLGIDIPEINTTLVNLQESDGPAIKCVNWITLLGRELSTQVGTLSAIREELPDDCEVIDLGDRYLIKAGARPLLGDKRKKERLPAYSAVGRLLAPYRLQTHAPLFLDDDDATEAWLGRFDD